jgi:hypothetical protein
MFASHKEDPEFEDEGSGNEEDVVLFKKDHAKFVLKSMMKQPRGMVGQDGGQPWFIYWNT